jgi:hypothetical protein
VGGPKGGRIMMTRKDYVKTAEILSNYFATSVFDEQGEILFADLVDEFSLMFETDNERFDANKFALACYKKIEVDA